MTGLYHVYGEADSLLYIGVSKHFGIRWQQHAQKQPWWNERRRMTVDFYDTRDEALDAEALAIFTEQPKYNVMHRKQALRLKAIKRREAISTPPGMPVVTLAPGVTPEMAARAELFEIIGDFTYSKEERDEARAALVYSLSAVAATEKLRGPVKYETRPGPRRLPAATPFYGTPEYEEMVHGTSPLAGGD